MQILGAGLAGLLAGSLFQRAQIFEAGSEDQVGHKAVLRFRSSAVGDALGIEFRPVTVHKGIWFNGRFVEPSIQVANLYSRKVIGRAMDRSVWNLAPAQRFIAPENLVEQMAERCAGRVSWNTRVDALPEPGARLGGPDVISTLPMSVMRNMLEPTNTKTESNKLVLFGFAPISVMRWRVTQSDVFQTVYFPDHTTNLYRASITGSLLIAEFMHSAETGLDTAPLFAEVFGLDCNQLHPIDTTTQRFGKIAPIDEAWRRAFIVNASLKHRVFSLGRFATWRNILLDDVLHDVAVIKKLLSADSYSIARRA